MTISEPNPSVRPTGQEPAEFIAPEPAEIEPDAQEPEAEERAGSRPPSDSASDSAS